MRRLARKGIHESMVAVGAAMDALPACAQGHPWEHGGYGRRHWCPTGLRARASMRAWWLWASPWMPYRPARKSIRESMDAMGHEAPVPRQKRAAQGDW